MNSRDVCFSKSRVVDGESSFFSGAESLEESEKESEKVPEERKSSGRRLVKNIQR